MKTIYINYDGGSMSVNLDRFFPSSSEQIRRLLKIIRLDWTHEDEIIQEVTVWLENEIPLCKNMYRENARQYLDAMQKLAEATERVNTKKNASGVPLTKDELKKARESKSFWNTTAKTHVTDGNRYKRKAERLEKNLEYIESLIRK